MKTSYDENYYESGIKTGISLYSNYKWMPELSIPMAHHVSRHLGINETHTVLDFGCAKGFLVKAFRLLGISSYGVDVSEYAINTCDPQVKDIVHLIEHPDEIQKYFPQKFDFILAKDVFEHIPYEQIGTVMTVLRKIGKTLFCVVPLGNGIKYNIPDYELDKTHIIKEDLRWWETQLRNAGYTNIDAKYYMSGIKENWSYEKQGNGFFICK
jgi:SAM-dependent methyltransferase